MYIMDNFTIVKPTTHTKNNKF